MGFGDDLNQLWQGVEGVGSQAVQDIEGVFGDAWNMLSGEAQQALRDINAIDTSLIQRLSQVGNDVSLLEGVALA